MYSKVGQPDAENGQWSIASSGCQVDVVLSAKVTERIS